MSAPGPPAHDRAACRPCRGTGKLISSLGGEPHEVRCPWCEGSGQFQAGHDAQAAGPADAEAGTRPDSGAAPAGPKRQP